MIAETPMMPASGALHVDAHSFHDVVVGDRRVLFHLPTSSLFQLDRVGGEVLDFVKMRPSFTETDVRDWIIARAPQGEAVTPAQVAEVLHDFQSLEILRTDATQRQESRLEVKEFPLSSLVISVSTGCNLSCSYCYKEDLDKPANGRKMDFDTATQGIELLLREGASREQINVVFLGGEPLTNLPLIKQVVAYTERRGAEEGKKVDFTMTTNATLLTEDIVSYLDEHRFGISVSMDGPKAVHDRRRIMINGRGSYDVVAAKAKMLLSRYRSRPVGARVTLSAGATDVMGIYRHLKNDIGFFEVGFAPVTTSVDDALNLSSDELREVFEGMKTLGKEYLEAAVQNRNLGFSNMHQLMSDLFEGRKKSLPCGAGVGLLALDSAGDLNLCHRFTGSTLPTFGNVVDGIAKDRLGGFIEAAADLTGKPCATCRIRKLCAGGCYHESYARYTDPLSPTYHYCDLMREWVDFGVAIYVELLEKNPSFLMQHIDSRRTKQ